MRRLLTTNSSPFGPAPGPRAHLICVSPAENLGIGEMSVKPGSRVSMQKVDKPVIQGPSPITLGMVADECHLPEDKYIFDNVNSFYDEYFEYEQGLSDNIHVKGRLKAHIGFWEKIGSNKVVLQMIENGLTIPFISTPKCKKFNNNKSARLNSVFVTQAILELLQTKRVLEVPVKPHVVNPLSVATGRGDKKRLILDLRYVNLHIWKECVKKIGRP